MFAQPPSLRISNLLWDIFPHHSCSKRYSDSWQSFIYSYCFIALPLGAAIYQMLITRFKKPYNNLLNPALFYTDWFNIASFSLNLKIMDLLSFINIFLNIQSKYLELTGPEKLLLAHYVGEVLFCLDFYISEDRWKKGLLIKTFCGFHSFSISIPFCGTSSTSSCLTFFTLCINIKKCCATDFPILSQFNYTSLVIHSYLF